MYQKLRSMRLKRHYTTGYMAGRLGISKPFYCQIETGKRRLSYNMAVQIAAIFRAKPDRVFYEDQIEVIKQNKKEIVEETNETVEETTEMEIESPKEENIEEESSENMEQE